jgi:hypothetical protein
MILLSKGSLHLLSFIGISASSVQDLGQVCKQSV